MINGLRPPILDECGVVAAIEHLVHEQSARGPKVTFEHEDFQRLTPTIETALFRIAQEALTNACKHSNSPEIAVVLKREGSSIHLGVLDRGEGFTPGAAIQGRHGLRGIRERVRLLGGTVQIESAPGRGTAVSVDLPLLPGVEGA